MLFDMLGKFHGQSLLVGNVSDRGLLYHLIALTKTQNGQFSLVKSLWQASEQG